MLELAGPVLTDPSLSTYGIPYRPMPQNPTIPDKRPIFHGQVSRFFRSQLSPPRSRSRPRPLFVYAYEYVYRSAVYDGKSTPVLDFPFVCVYEYVYRSAMYDRKASPRTHSRSRSRTRSLLPSVFRVRVRVRVPLRYVRQKSSLPFCSPLSSLPVHVHVLVPVLDFPFPHSRSRSRSRSHPPPLLPFVYGIRGRLPLRCVRRKKQPPFPFSFTYSISLSPPFSFTYPFT